MARRQRLLIDAHQVGGVRHAIRPGFRHKFMQALGDYMRNAEFFRDHAGNGFF